MAVADATPEQAPSLWRRAAVGFLRRREASTLIVVAALVAYFSIQSSAFLSLDNMRTLSEFAAPIALITAGEVMLLICGQIDLSVGRVYALTPAIMYLATQEGLPVGVGVVLGMLAAAGVGLTNGFFTVVLRVPSFITTLGMLFLLNGVTLNLLNGFQVPTPGGETFTRIMGGAPYSSFWWALGLVILVQLLLIRTRWGLHTVATGGNPIGARESGVNVGRITIGNFVLCSMLGGFAGILESVRITSILPLQGGPEIMFLAVAAAVIGGTSLLGGSGTVAGGFLGVLFIVILQDGFTLLGVSAFNFTLILGVAILISMTLNVYLQRLRSSGRLQ